MLKVFQSIMAGLCAGALFVVGASAASAAGAAPHQAHANFRTAVYVTVDATRRLSDPAVFAREFARVYTQAPFDHVYIEDYRDSRFATDAQIEAVKHMFEAKGIAVSGGVTLAAGGRNGQFGTFDYENPRDLAECKEAVERAARHFDQVILDDFFFYNTKSDADIAAKGKRSWTQYRIARMRQVARDVVLKSARAVNPHVHVIIKFPNWYEHFQGLGFDLEKEPHMFGAIYTGTETRDPVITDQLLQQYESFGVIRFMDAILPGGNLGGWVDTFDTRYADRYAEQLWDTLFAKAPEMTLFSWDQLADMNAIKPGDRPWANSATSFDWKKMVAGYHATPGAKGPGWASVAGAALATVDPVLAHLGHVETIPSYKPYRSSSAEDFLENYLGNIGLPVAATPVYPTQAPLVLLTEAARTDPHIVAKMEASLRAGHSVVITSGLLQALQDKGFGDIAEWRVTGRVAAIRKYYNGYGAGSGNLLNDPAKSRRVLFPEIHFFTNDSWSIIRGVAGEKAFPVLLMNHYSKGVIYVLDVPDNIADLYNLPEGVLTQIKTYLQQDFPLRIAAPPQVALFAYDNGAFVVESYRAKPARVTVILSGHAPHLADAMTGKAIAANAAAGLGREDDDSTKRMAEKQRKDIGEGTAFTVTLPAHSFRAFRYRKNSD